jgi:hypothetical protein
LQLRLGRSVRHPAALIPVELPLKWASAPKPQDRVLGTWCLTISGLLQNYGNPEVISSPVGLVPTNALVLCDLANLRVDDNPEVGSSVLLIGVARIQSNFEPIRKQVALFEL